MLYKTAPKQAVNWILKPNNDVCNGLRRPARRKYLMK
jgi:hypothetical protein